MKFALRAMAASTLAAGLVLATAALGQPASAPTAAAPTPTPPPADATTIAHGKELFDLRCVDCHDPPVEDAPSREDIAAYKPDFIVGVLKNGSMEAKATGLRDADLNAIAAYLTAH